VLDLATIGGPCASKVSHSDMGPVRAGPSPKRTGVCVARAPHEGLGEDLQGTQGLTRATQFDGSDLALFDYESTIFATDGTQEVRSSSG
jgi:hypothetical protein